MSSKKSTTVLRNNNNDFEPNENRRIKNPTSVEYNSEDDYDPHEHRQIRNPTNNWQTMAHFLKASIGTGVLAMPSAFANAGYVNGIILTLLIGVIAVYCLRVMISSMYVLCKKKRVPYLTYSEAMKLGLQEGPKFLSCLVPISIPLVDGFLAFYQFGICCAYVVFISESNKQIIDEYFVVLDIRVHITIVLVPLLVIFSIRSLKLLAFFTAFANMLLIAGFAVILYYIFVDLPSLTERKPVEDIGKWPILFGITMFSIEAIGVILAIEENMKTPKVFLKPFGIMNMSMTIIITLYIAIGFLGYWKYGDDTLGSITLNIPQEEILSQVTKIIFAFTILITYAIQGYVTIDIIWNKYLSKKIDDTTSHGTYELILRTVLVFLTYVCAILVPALSLVISLVGSFCLSILGIIFPALLQICVQYNTSFGPYKIYLFLNIFLMMFGLFGGFLGTYVSISNIIKTLYL